jgi:hypothetical protein
MITPTGCSRAEGEKSMVESLANAASNALAGIGAATGRIDRAASRIAEAGTDASAPAAAAPLTGGRIGNAAGVPLQGNDGDLATNLIAVAAAKISYAANAKVLGTVDRLDRETLDIVT